MLNVPKNTSERGQAVKNGELVQAPRKASNPLIRPISRPRPTAAPAPPGPSSRAGPRALRDQSANFLEPMDPKSAEWGKKIDHNAARQQIKEPTVILPELRDVHRKPTYSLPKPAPREADVEALTDLLDTLTIDKVDGAPANTIPGLVPKLMDHQVEGVKFMCNREEAKWSGGLLCDDMGLGKTVQSIALILKNAPERDATIKTTLVVSPLAVMYQWVEEIKSKAPGLKVTTHQGPKRAKNVSELLCYDVVVTTFDTVSSDFPGIEDEKQTKKTEVAEKEENNEKKIKKKKDDGPLMLGKWYRIIADEGHQFRNPKTAISNAMNALQSEGRRWVLTGTPIHNSVDDMFSLFRYIRITPYDNPDNWKSTIGDPISRKNATPRQRDDAIKLLKGILSEVLLRRQQKVIKLPECVRHRVKVKLNDKETATMNHILEIFRKVDKELLLVTKVLRARQLCNDISSLPPKFIPGGDVSTSNNVSSASDELAELLNDVSLDEPSSTIASNTASDSSKLKAIVKVCKQEPKRKTVMFSSFVTMLRSVASALKAEGIDCLVYHGELTVDARREMLEDFRRGNKYPVLLCSLTCAAVGINITCATRVVMIDPWWNPMIVDQAVNRVHRIGQTEKVDVYEMMVLGSIEERIFQLQDRKRQQSSHILEKQEKLSKDELHYLIFGERRGKGRR